MKNIIHAKSIQLSITMVSGWYSPIQIEKENVISDKQIDLFSLC